MSPLPLTIAQALTEQRQAELRALAGPMRIRSARPRRRGRLRRWAHGWFDRVVPGPNQRPNRAESPSK